MTEESHSTNSLSSSSWLERLRNAFAAEPKDRNQLVDLLRVSQKRSLFDADALTMIEGVLQVSELHVRDIMIPRSQIVILELDADIESMLATIVNSGHSRFPVVGDSRDEVEGILLAKDMLQVVVEKEQSKVVIRDLLRPAVYVPESKRLNVLLKEFRASRNHMAIVVDEYGGVAGIVTIEDVIEQIVGEIADEHDVDEGKYIFRHSDSRFTVKALTPVEDFNEQFNTEFNVDEFDTISGVLLNRFGRLPKRNEIIKIGNLEFRILRSDARRIHLVQVTVDTDKVENDKISTDNNSQQAI